MKGIEKQELEFIRTRAVNKLLGLKKRIRIAPGSTSAGKTIGILSILIDKCIKIPNLEVSVVAESIPHLKKGALKDFLKIMRITKRFDKACYNKTERLYTFPNGSYMEFFGVLDDPDKLRGPRRDILYMNEASSLPWESYQQASIRTNLEIWLDFNPSHEFWAHEELLLDPDAEWLTLTYLDNEALHPALIRELKKNKAKAFYDPDLPDDELLKESNCKNLYWVNWWKVYGMGLLGSLEGVVFNDWSQIPSIPDEAKYLGSAIDFGYTNDPTTIIDYYRFNGLIIWDERTYMTGLKNHQIARLLKSQGKTRKTRIIADSAEPKSIDEINDYGFNVQPAEKGPDSINFGIDIIQQEPFLVTARSTNIINELRKYMWDQDKNGKFLNVPVDAFNHTIDPSRYFYTRWLSNKNKVDTTAAKRALKKALQYFK
jgi:phage terminase large subunit